MEYIEREAILAEQRHLYCENCARRKGMKNGKTRFVYEIGDAPCRACGYGDVLESVEDFPAADVRPVVRGVWKLTAFDDGYGEYQLYQCDKCGAVTAQRRNYCHNCGADMRGEENA